MLRNSHTAAPTASNIASRLPIANCVPTFQVTALISVFGMLATTAHVHVATGFRGWGMTNGVAAGLAITRDPVFSNYFDLKVRRETGYAAGGLA